MSSGAAGEDGLALFGVVPTGTSRASVVEVTIRGVPGSASKLVAARVLDSIAVAPLAYADVMGLLSADPATIPATLEGHGLSYVPSPNGEGGTWSGTVEDGPAGADLVKVSLVRQLDERQAWPTLTRKDLEAGCSISGVQADWTGAHIPWDEPLDTLDDLVKTYRLTPCSESGFVDGPLENGSYTWAAVGSFEIAGRQGYWLVWVAMDEGETGTVSLSADYFDNGHLAPGQDIDDIVSAIW